MITKQEISNLLEEAQTLLNSGQFVEALRIAEKAISYQIFVPELHYIYALCSSKVGRHEEALIAARKELEENPTNEKAQNYVTKLSQAIEKPRPPQIPNDQRSWGTSIPYDFLTSIQNSTHNYSYRGIPTIKNPFDFALYPLLLWNLKPRTIIEIGSKSGGSGLWFADILQNFGIDGHVYSVDIVKVTKVSHPRLTFLAGDGEHLEQVFSEEFLDSIPRPLLVIEDANHSYKLSIAVLNFFDPYLQSHEYIVIEDGIISDLQQDSSFRSGPHRALKDFLSRRGDDYAIDSEYCDWFGYNVTWCTNGFLRKS
ncbi:MULTISPECIES: CmcI family methyltransferase [Spirulina sp. CCY15215]|uniref:CmcI family methyltransferase n=1 Tax=Spirulina sp. CCY15215 TaxID=2767591 RepID=UPI00194DB715